jgi:hypothetical protein
MKWRSMEKRIRLWVYGDHSRDEMRARVAYHKFANEAQATNARLRQMKSAPDPWQELVRALRGCDRD